MLRDDESEKSGSDKEREVKEYINVGLHSPFGWIGDIKERTGYTHEYILWGQAWILFLLEEADRSRTIDKNKLKSEENTEVHVSSIAELKALRK